MSGDSRARARPDPAWPAGRPATPSALEQITQRLPTTPDETFVALPAPLGTPPFRRQLVDVIGAERREAIDRAGVLRFHCIGDTGGWRDSAPQRAVAAAMVAELGGEMPVDFFYHLGDIVYPHGEEAHYGPQFFSPYASYAAPIFAIPGNHDAESNWGSRGDPLDPFVKTFCSWSPPLHDAAVGLPRPVVAQPHVYWTLVHDWVWIIGLYSNVPEGGQLAADQLSWLIDELRSAPPDVTVILAMHQPVYSVDVVHGSNLELSELLDACFARAGRVPDAVFGGHAHNYQRFARRLHGRQIPYLVAGSGGFPERHAIGSGFTELPASFPGLPDVTLEAYQVTHHGFMTVSVGRAGARVVYNTVAGAAREFDTFRIAPGRLI